MDKKKFLETIENDIQKYSKKLSFYDYSRNIPNYTFTDREKDIIEDVAKQVQNNCSEFLNGKMSSRDIEQLAGYLMFGQYNPKLLHRLLNEDFFNFIMLLGEYTHYFEW